jgi:uncharacterized membrane protein
MNADPRGLRDVDRMAAPDDGINVGNIERIGSILAGGLLIAYALGKRSALSTGLAVAGGILIYRGAVGHSYLYDAIGVDTAHPADDERVVVKKGVKVERTVTIDRSPEELYAFWRHFENLPRFMNHLESVTTTDDMHSHWVAKAPVGKNVEWDAEIINEIPDQLIAWRSLGNADVQNVGSVHFETAPGGRGAEVTVVLQYAPPMGKIGAAVAKLLGEEPSIQIEEDLRRFKQLMETGETATTEGQPRG